MDQPLSPGFSLSGDADGRWPLVLASPHSGREYPQSFLRASPLSLAQLRRAEDAYVDHLLDGVSGIPVLKARWSRLYLDLNRASHELDATMFDAPLNLPARRSERVEYGLGVLPRVAGYGLDIYRSPIAVSDAAHRIASLHLPWHSRITSLLASARRLHGHAVLVDCHSMPRPAGISPPQIVLGDRHGRSASPTLVRLIEAHFEAQGLRVARNSPYAGGYTTEHHGQPQADIHAIQIEIDRNLYMDPLRLTPNQGFERMARCLQSLVHTLLQEMPAMGLGKTPRTAPRADWPIAAE